MVVTITLGATMGARLRLANSAEAAAAVGVVWLLFQSFARMEVDVYFEHRLPIGATVPQKGVTMVYMY